MKPNDPTTWLDLSTHPAFEGVVFDPEWYDGDAAEDLQMLRLAAIELKAYYAHSKFELMVLDDCTMYLTFEAQDSIQCELYPARTDEYKPCYFLEIEGCSDEIRVVSIKEVLDALNQHIKQY